MKDLGTKGTKLDRLTEHVRDAIRHGLYNDATTTVYSYAAAASVFLWGPIDSPRSMLQMRPNLMVTREYWACSKVLYLWWSERAHWRICRNLRLAVCLWLMHGPSRTLLGNAPPLELEELQIGILSRSLLLTMEGTCSVGPAFPTLPTSEKLVETASNNRTRVLRALPRRKADLFRERFPHRMRQKDA